MNYAPPSSALALHYKTLIQYTTSSISNTLLVPLILLQQAKIDSPTSSGRIGKKKKQVHRRNRGTGKQAKIVDEIHECMTKFKNM